MSGWQISYVTDETTRRKKMFQSCFTKFSDFLDDGSTRCDTDRLFKWFKQNLVLAMKTIPLPIRGGKRKQGSQATAGATAGALFLLITGFI